MGEITGERLFREAGDLGSLGKENKEICSVRVKVRQGVER